MKRYVTYYFGIIFLILFINACSEQSDSNAVRNKNAVVVISDDKYVIDSKYISRFSRINKSDRAFSLDLCLPDLKPESEGKCIERSGWGRTLRLYIQASDNLSLEDYYNRVVDYGLRNNCWKKVGVSEFSDQLIHFVNMRCGTNSIGKETDWEDVYLRKDWKNTEYYRLSCSVYAEGKFPGCKVYSQHDGLRILYSFGQEHLSQYQEIHQNVLKLLSMFKE